MEKIKQKIFEIKKRILYFVLCHNFWKKQWNVESDKGHWEIINDNDNEIITLLYIPNEDNEMLLGKIKKISMPHQHFHDLVKFIIKIA